MEDSRPFSMEIRIRAFVLSSGETGERSGQAQAIWTPLDNDTTTTITATDDTGYRTGMWCQCWQWLAPRHPCTTPSSQRGRSSRTGSVRILQLLSRTETLDVVRSTVVGSEGSIPENVESSDLQSWDSGATTHVMLAIQQQKVCPRRSLVNSHLRQFYCILPLHELVSFGGHVYRFRPSRVLLRVLQRATKPTGSEPTSLRELEHIA